MRSFSSAMIAIVLVLVSSGSNFTPGQEIIPGITIPSVADIPVPPENEARAYYEAATGDIYLTINGNVLVAGLEGADFLVENADNSTPLGQIAGEFGIGGGGFSGLANGTFNIGNILPADPSIRTTADFAAKYPDAVFRSAAPGIPEIRSQLNVIAIPEPGSGILLLIATSGWLGHRRR